MDEWNCIDCRWFEESSGFCRRNPPIPVQVYRDKKWVTTSKFPKIVRPDKDWCSMWRSYNDGDNQDDFELTNE